MGARQRRSKRILVLSGGGGRGAYHIGVMESGRYPDLAWLAIVAPDHYLTVGLMTHYQLEFHRQLFELGYWDARKDLANVLPLPDKS